MTLAYKALLRLYPPEYREIFANEMLSVFEEVLQEHRRRGALRLLSFLFTELVSIINGALKEWIARFTYSLYHSNSYISRSCMPNRLLMRHAGVAREAYFVEAKPGGKNLMIPDDSGMCVNVHQRFVSASPLRRLFMLTCAMFFPMHRS